MKLLSSINKFILVIFWVTLISIVSVLVYINNTNNFLILHYSKELKKIIKSDNKNVIPKLMNDYNSVFLPKTQYKDFDFDKKRINFLEANDCYSGKCYTFFLETYKKNLLIIDKNNNLYFSKIADFVNNKNFKKIETNLKLNGVTDFFINDNDIYISGYIKSEDNKFSLVVYKSSIQNLNKIQFDKIFQESDARCISAFQLGGKMKYYKDDNLNGLLLTTGFIRKSNDSILEEISNDSVCGKILIIDKKKNNWEIFSKGHRNILGLYVDKKLVLATENGPNGGDEINNIFYKKNYGWPAASYGTIYDGKRSHKKIHYKKNHKIYSFEEPIFAFTPSIGISEIIRLPNNFSTFWQNNFLIGSLNKKTLYRVKFDDNYNKLLYSEEIFIGERIRDIIYLKDEKMILLSLELSGSIGIIQNTK